LKPFIFLFSDTIATQRELITIEHNHHKSEAIYDKANKEIITESYVNQGFRLRVSGKCLHSPRQPAVGRSTLPTSICTFEFT